MSNKAGRRNVVGVKAEKAKTFRVCRPPGQSENIIIRKEEFMSDITTAMIETEIRKPKKHKFNYRFIPYSETK